MEQMFRNDFNNPIVDSMMGMSMEDPRALTQMERSVKIVDGHYQLGVTKVTHICKPVKQLRICINKIKQSKEMLSA